MRRRVICCLVASLGLAVAAPRLILRRARGTRPLAVESRRGKNLLRIAKVGPVSVPPTAAVLDAIKTMETERVGAVLITDDGEELKGILTERDIMLRVVLRLRDPKTTPVSEVMTASVTTIENDRTQDDALRKMATKRIRHLPVMGASGKVEGMLSLRHLLGQKVESLERNLDSLAAYISADGIGG